MRGGERCARARWRGALRRVLASLASAAATAAGAAPLALDVAAPDAAHVAWLSAQRLEQQTRRRGVVLEPRLTETPAPAAHLTVMSLHDLSHRVPELGVLALPYFYPDRAAVHRALDGPLGRALAAAGRSHGWELLAVWDEGLQLLSGNMPYTHPRTLSGAEFVLLRDDPVAEKELRALDAWTRRARPASLPQLHKECVVSSRAATAQQVAREQLQRVHLDLTLSRHRYEGWAVAMPLTAWNALELREQRALQAALAAMRSEQRRLAAREEERALDRLREDGMTVHALAPATWQAYRAMQPPAASLLAGIPDAALRRRLIGTAAAAAGLRSDPRPDPALAQPGRGAP